MRISLQIGRRAASGRTGRPAAAVPAALALLAALAAAGCSAPPLDVTEWDSVRSLRAGIGSPMAASLAVSVAADSAKWGQSREADGYSCRVKADAAAMRRVFAESAAKIGLFEKVVESEAAAPDAEWSADPEGADFLAVLELVEHRVSYEGRNIWWVPNLVLWAVVWVPSWIIPDEDYSGRADFAVRVYHRKSGKLLREFKAGGGFETSLNDFQALWHLWGIILVPFVLDEEDYEEIAPEVMPHALNGAAAEFLKSMAEFRKDVEAGRIGIPKPPEPAPPAPGPKEPSGGEGHGGPGGDGPAKPPDKPPVPGPTPKPAPRNTALVVGSAPQGAAGAGDLCAADARRVAERLRSTGRYGEGGVTLLYGGSATLAAIRSALADAAGSSAGDSILLYFAGFGFQSAGAAGPEGYLALADTAGGSEASALGLKELFESLSRAAAGSKTVVLDLSFGPAGGARAMSAKGQGNAALRDLLAPLGRPKGLSLFAADGGGGGAVELAEAGGGLFTHYFLKAIAGEADDDRDGDVSAGELESYVGKHASLAASLLGEFMSPFASAESAAPVLPAGR